VIYLSESSPYVSVYKSAYIQSGDRNRFITHMFLHVSFSCGLVGCDSFGCLSAGRHGGPYFLVNFASCCVCAPAPSLADFGRKNLFEST
jgi:hypothetical protein